MKPLTNRLDGLIIIEKFNIYIGLVYNLTLTCFQVQFAYQVHIV
jgi:hypothetical protein